MSDRQKKMSLKKSFDSARIKQTYRKKKQKKRALKKKKEMLKTEQITDLWRAKREKQHL